MQDPESETSAASLLGLGHQPWTGTEAAIRGRLSDESFDFLSLLAVSNICRAAALIRRRAEQEVLHEAGLSWGGFSILWTLWIWGDTDMTHLARRCEVTKPTLTGMLTTLERQELVVRRRVTSDRRRVSVALTPAGNATITELFPRYNSFEGQVTGTLDDEEKAQLAELLRQVIRLTHGDEQI